MRNWAWALIGVICGWGTFSTVCLAEPDVQYDRDVAPLLRKYCAGCHHQEDAESGFAADSYASLMKGFEGGAVLVPGDSGVSRLMRLIRGEIEPQMPPAGEAQPTPEEQERLAAWIDAGAVGPAGDAPPLMLQAPSLGGLEERQPISAQVVLPGNRLAIARGDRVSVWDMAEDRLVQELSGHAGKVNALACDADGKFLLVAGGIEGLRGELKIWNLADFTEQATWGEHRDALYAVAFSPDGTRIATGGYDRRVILWETETGKPQHVLTQHNGAIYSLAFSPDGRLLASASADETVKVWNVADGSRLDTLGQPEGEQYIVRFSPDGRWIVAGGADNRIRAWEVPSGSLGGTHPLRFTRFAHEGGVVALAFSPDGQLLLSAADDRTMKSWSTTRFLEEAVLPEQSDVVTSLEAVGPGRFSVTRIDGSREILTVKPPRSPLSPGWTPGLPTSVASAESAGPQGELPPETPRLTLEEQEPNDTPAQAQWVLAAVDEKSDSAFTADRSSLPASGITIQGTIHREGNAGDLDHFLFPARKGETWILETRAAQMKSPLDTRIEVLTEQGERIERLLLQAVRDSYFTFRGKNSTQTGDFRLHNWEEMELNQLLFASGEVVKLYRYPRGPDSGFDVYPGFGNRHTWFDTTSVSHALGEPAYIVEPRQPGEPLIPNGLPVFPIYFENDDDAEGKLGTDSRLTFIAPEDGNYVVRIRDTRGFSGPEFRYELTIRKPRPDFSVALAPREFKVPRGVGKMFTLTAQREDGFRGAIRVDIENVPEGYYIPSPIVIEAGHLQAQGAVYASPDLQESESLPKERWAEVQFRATSLDETRPRTHGLAGITSVTLEPEAPILLTLSPDRRGATSPASDQAEQSRAGEAQSPTEKATAEETEELQATAEPKFSGLESIPTVRIRPGETIQLTLAVDRREKENVLGFGKEDAGRNFPHGVYVDNIGLNGVLMLPEQSERQVFVTADRWVPGNERLVFLRCDQFDGPCAWPIRLVVEETR